jgi:hypothetical protein
MNDSADIGGWSALCLLCYDETATKIAGRCHYLIGIEIVYECRSSGRAIARTMSPSGVYAIERGNRIGK